VVEVVFVDQRDEGKEADEGEEEAAEGEHGGMVVQLGNWFNWFNEGGGGGADRELGAHRGCEDSGGRGGRAHKLARGGIIRAGIFLLQVAAETCG
jgi:hypothetical protein